MRISIKSMSIRIEKNWNKIIKKYLYVEEKKIIVRSRKKNL